MLPTALAGGYNSITSYRYAEKTPAKLLLKRILKPILLKTDTPCFVGAECVDAASAFMRMRRMRPAQP
jgi:hypothetical protein